MIITTYQYTDTELLLVLYHTDLVILLLLYQYWYSNFIIPISVLEE